MRCRCLLVVPALVSLASLAEAQEAAPSGQPQVESRRQGRGEARSERHARREEAFRLVDAYMVSHLQESLGLRDEQYAKLLPLVTRLQAGRREYFLGRMRALRELRRLVQSAAAESEIASKLEELKRLESEAPVRANRDMEALDAALTPVQRAKFRLLELAVEQRMRRLMSRAHQGEARDARPPDARPPDARD